MGAVFVGEEEVGGVAMPCEAVDVVHSLWRGERDGAIHDGKGTVVSVPLFELGFGGPRIVAIVLVRHYAIEYHLVHLDTIICLERLHEDLPRRSILSFITRRSTIYRHANPRHIGDNLTRCILWIDIVPFASDTILEVHGQDRLLFGGNRF